MAKNIRDMGYSSSMDNYNQQQEKRRREQEKRKAQEKQQGPVSTQRLTLPKAGTASGRASSTYGPPAPKNYRAPSSSANRQRHTREKTVAPGTATVSRGNRVSSGSVGNARPAGYQPMPISAERASAIPYNVTAPVKQQEIKLSEPEFNRSTAMRKSYGSYENYLNGVRVTAGGYHSPTAQISSREIAHKQENLNNLWTAMEVYNNDVVEPSARIIEKTYRSQRQQSSNLMFLEHQHETGAISDDAYNAALDRYKESYERENSLDAQRHRSAAYGEYMANRYNLERMWNTYQGQAAHLNAQIEEYRQSEQDRLGSVRTEEEILADIAALEQKISGESNQKQVNTSLQGRQQKALIMGGTASGRVNAKDLEYQMNASDENKRLDMSIENDLADLQLLYEELETRKSLDWDKIINADMPVSVWRAQKPENSLIDKVISGEATTEEQLRAIEDFNFNSNNADVMTDAERKNYETIKRKYGSDKALEYYYDLEKRSLNTRRRQEEEQTMRDIMDSSPAAYIGMNALSVLAKPLQVFSRVGQLSDRIFNHGEMTKDADYNAFVYLNNAIRNKTDQDISETWGKWGSFGYQTAMSMADFVFNAAITGGLGGNPTKLAEEAGLLLMGYEAAADATMQAKDRGLSDRQSFWMGTVAGAAEYITEKVSLEKLLDKVPLGKGWKGYVQYWAQNVISEASEEGASDLINLVADILITKEQSEWAQAVREYEKQGMDANEAFIHALTDQAEKTGMSMLGGALSGGTMAGGTMALSSFANYKENSARVTQPSYVNLVVQEGLNLKEGTEGYKAAQDLQKSLEAGKVNAGQVLKAQKTIDTDRRTDRKYVGKLIQQGKTYNGTRAFDVATDLRSRLDSGKDVTISEINKLEKAVYEAKATDPASLKKSIQLANQNPDGKAAQYAAEIESKLDAGEKVSLKEAERLDSLITDEIEQAYSGNNPEALGNMLTNGNAKEYLSRAASEVLLDGSDTMQTKAAALQEQIKTGNINARTAGEIAIEAERLRSKQQTGTRALTPREVTDDMDDFDRSAAQTGVSVEEAARHKAIMKAFGIEGEYRNLDNDRVNAYYDSKTGKMVLNARSSNLGLSVIAHEVTHSLEGTDSYKKLQDMILKKKGGAKDAILKAITDKYESAGITLDADGAQSELVAEYVEKQLLTDENAIREVVRENRTFGEWMRDKIDDLLASLGSESAQERQFLRQAREYYAKALQERDAGQTTQSQETAQSEETAMDEGPKGLALPKSDDGIRNSISTYALTAGVEMRRDGGGKLSFYINGKQVTSVTKEHIRDHSAFGALITTAYKGITDRNGNVIQRGHITKAQADAQYEAVAELMNLVLKTQDPELTWAVAGSQLFSAVKSNSDGQYGTTVDFTTVCRKTQEMIVAMSERMMAKKGGLTKTEVIDLQKELIGAELSVPCPVCYVFSRWAGVGSLLDNMYTFQNKYADYTPEQIQARIDELKARDTKAERAGIRANLRNAESEMYDEAYTDLAAKKELLQSENDQMRKQLRAAKKNGIQADIDSLTKSIEFNKDTIKGLDKQMKEIIDAADTGGKELVWLQKVRQKAGYMAVRPEILFNMADEKAVETFMKEYPDSWNYRTTRGPAMGKAILPYSDFRLGDFALPLTRNSAAMHLKDKRNSFSNPLGIHGQFNTAQKNDLIAAIARVRAQNLIGGQRFQSTSDFRYDYALDYIQTFFEAQALGSNMQTYTKIIEFAEMVAKFGGDVNMSVMPKNKGYENGHLICSNVTGIDFGAAKLLSEKYDSAQLILVGINDEHIRLALEDSEETGGRHVGFVIPYHASGASIDTFIRDLVRNLGEDFVRENYTDYSTVQTDTIKAGATQAQRDRRNLRWQLLTGKKRTLVETITNGETKTKKKTIDWVPTDADINEMRRFARKKVDITGRSFDELLDIENRALKGDPDAVREYERWTSDLLYNLYKKMWTKNGKENGVRLNASQAEAVMPHEYWDKSSTRDTAYINGFLFRSYCFNLGLHPRFTGINSKGETVDFGDFRDSTGYWKTLIDRAMYDNNGNYRDQQKINLSELNVGMLNENAARAQWGDAMVRKPDVEKAAKIGRGELTLPKVGDAADEFTGATNEEREANLSAEAANLRYSVIRDPDLIRKLDEGEYITRYRWVQEHDGKYYSPMAGMVDGKWTDPIEFEKWEQADERPDLVYIPKGKKDYYFKLVKGLDEKGNENALGARYNPYIHSSSNVFGDQFTSAINRPELRVMEVRIPKSELTSGYKAQYAKDAVGDMKWHSGPVSTALGYISPKNARIVTLSRYDMPVRVLSTQEVAQQMADILKDTNIPVPEYTVTPDMLAELKRLGVRTVKKMPDEFRAKSLQKAQREARKQAKAEGKLSLPKAEQRYSVSRQQDTAYLKAVESGDMETAQRMVDEAAKKAGYTVRKYHQTNVPNIHVFDIGIGTHGGTDSETPYGIFSKNSRADIGLGDIQMRLYLKAGNTFTISSRNELRRLMPEAYELLAIQLDEIDAMYEQLAQQAEDALFDAQDAYEEEHPDVEISIDDIVNNRTYNDPVCQAANNRWKAVMAEWNSEADKIRVKLKGVLTDYLRSNGYDSMEINLDRGSNGRSTDTFIVLDPNQAKLGDPVTYDDSGKPIPLSERFNPENKDIRYAVNSVSRDKNEPLSDLVDGFYSKLAREIDAFKGNKLGASSVVSYLKGRGVKDEEIKWSGINMFLEGKKSVTKQELIDFVNTALPKIDVEEITDDWESGIVNKQHWHTRWKQYRLDGGWAYREYLYRLRGSDYTNTAMDMHWNTPGVLFHARVQDFLSSNNNPVLFIEEIQSDWHNEGHKKGYAYKGLYDEARAVENRRKEILEELDNIDYDDRLMEIEQRLAIKAYDEFGYYRNESRGSPMSAYRVFRALMDGVDSRGRDNAASFLANSQRYYNLVSLLNDADREHVEQLADRRRELTAEYDKVLKQAIELHDRAPDAPYSKTYHEYVLKDMLRRAAEGGYKYLAWTPGWMQEERWSDEYAEGYRIEYDQDIPKFLKKYGKQWGASVGTVYLDGVYDEETGELREIPAIEITPAMAESVLTKGQPRFSISNQRTESDLIESVINPEESPKAGIEDALDSFFAAADIGTDIPGMELVATGTKKNAKLPAGYKAQEAARFFYRKMVDSGEAVTRLGKYSKDPHLYHYYNMARASSNAAVSMIQDAQTDVMGRKVGDSLNDIFKEIRAKGDNYYRDLEAYLYHLHNVDRMSRAKPGAVAAAQAELEQFRRDNPELNGMADFQIERLAGDSTSFYQAQAQLYMDILRRLQRAEKTHNKPVFGMTVSAETSREAAQKLREKLEQTEGFEEDVEKIYAYIDNLMRYRIDSGLITEEEYENLRKIYPNYVPTYRLTEQESARARQKNRTEVGKTVGRAEGGDAMLMPLHRSLAQQTFSVVREGSKNRFGQMLLNRQGVSKGMIKNIEKAEGGFNEDTFDQEDATPKKERTFVVRRDGKRWEISMDNALYEAVSVLSPEPTESNFLINLVHKGNDLFKALNTSLNPAFLIRNPIRDLQDAGLYSKDLSEFVKQYPQAAKEIAKNGKYWQWYKALGGLYSSMFDFMTGEVREHGKARKYTLDILEGVNMAVEQAPRLAEFMAIIKKAEAKGEVTMDVLMDAMHSAADVTVNFGRSGKWGKMLNKSIIPFFNPGIQGFDKTVRTFAESKDFKAWAKLAGKCALFGILPAILNNLLYRKKKDWEKMKQSDRDLYYLFPLGNSGVWLRLPKGRALSVFGMVADRLMQGKDADWASFIRTAIKQTAPETKTYWQPFLDAQLFDSDNPGKTWYGGDIENRRMQSLAPGERYDTSTDAISKWIGKTFGLSPKKVNYLLDQYSGVIGEIFLPLMSQKPHKDLFTNSFSVDTVVSNRLSSDFYSALDEATYAKNSPEATPEETAAYKYLNGKSQAINQVNAAIREIEQDDSLSNKEKQELTRAQYMLRNEIMQDAISQLESYKKGETDNDIYNGAEEERAQKARESKTYDFKGQEMSWDDLSGRQKKIVMAQEAVDEDKNADLTDILGNKAPSQGAMYSAARDAGISNQKYLDALTAVDDANNGDSNYTNAETQAGLDQAIAAGKITAADANTLWPIISGGSPKNNPYASGGLKLPSVDTGASQASSQASSYENRTYTFNGEEKPYIDLSGNQKRIVQAQDALKNDPDADLSDIIGSGNATKKLAQYQEARDKGISNQTYIDALKAIDDADDGNGTYNQKEAKAGLEQMISDGKITEKDAGIIWKIITEGSDKNNPFPVAAFMPIGLRLPKIGR